MDFDKSLSSLEAKLNQIHRVFERLALGESVTAIDLDLAKASMIQLYEQLLNPAIQGDLHGSIVTHTEIKKTAEPVLKSKKEKLVAPPMDPVIILPSTPKDSILTIEPDTKPEKTTAEEPRGKSGVKAPEIVGEKFQDNKKYVNEALTDRSRKNQKDISSMMQNKPIQSIESAIGINDKFIFIKELFNGNAQQYKETLDLLNNTSDFNTAVQYIEQHFSWDMESEAVMKLLDLLRRRYIPHSNG
jgi:hypothetical protein